MPPSHGLTRRGFLLGAATGLAAGAPAAWFAGRHFPSLPAPGTARTDYAMPGPFPGRVIEVRNPGVFAPDGRLDPAAVDVTIDRGLAALTGVDDPRDVRASWGRFFQKGDVVGIKVNPVGRKPHPGEAGRVAGAAGAISSPEVLVKVVRSLRAVGVRPQDIIVFERYADEFIGAGYADLVERELPGVRWYASAWAYSNDQVDVAGFDGGRGACPTDAVRHVAGYDPDVFTVMGYCSADHDRRDDRRFRSHLSLIVTRLVDKVINLPVLKDHRSAGVTLALKNLSHGMNNNVARSHLARVAHGFGPGTEQVNGPNQCNTFIPQAASQHVLRQKATLHLLDGLVGVYEGGPGCWNQTWGTWRHGGLFFATDPVALDHVGWDVIDRQRARAGWEPVARMGLLYHTPAVAAGTTLAPLAAAGVPGALTLGAAALNREQGRASETFNRRQPEHVILAGEIGLGVFPGEQIRYQLIEMRG